MTPTKQGPSQVQVTKDLLLILSTLQSHPALARALTDPSAPSQARAKLIDRAFASTGEVSRTTLKEALGKNWDSTKSLLNWVESTAVKTAWQWADQEGILPRCIDEVFSFGHMMVHNHEVRALVTDSRQPLTNRQDLVRTLLAPANSDPSIEIATAAVAFRHGTIDDAIEHFLKIGADLIDSQIAVVCVAKPLDSRQRKDMTAALENRMGTKIIIQEIVDPSLLGGVRVECGAEVIDSTLTSRLASARRDFA